MSKDFIIFHFLFPNMMIIAAADDDKIKKTEEKKWKTLNSSKQQQKIFTLFSENPKMFLPLSNHFIVL